MLKAIPTKYNGYYFRSRLEARWAVFFDALGIQYDYEPEGYVLEDGIWYLPDFKLHNVGLRSAPKPLWIEIKPGDPSEDDDKKIEQLVKGTGIDGLILTTNPWGPGGNFQFMLRDDKQIDWDYNMTIFKCYKCGALKFEFWENSYKVCNICNERSDEEHPMILRAIGRAKSAGF